jgi:hypothetical protein
MKLLELTNAFQHLDPNMSRGLYSARDKEATKELQAWLNDNGYDSGKVDGIYGPKTIQAVRNFQSDAGLKTDGDAGKDTISKIVKIATGVEPLPTQVQRGIDPDAKKLPKISAWKAGDVVNLLGHYAAKYRINKDFVMAIAQKESNMDPTAIGDTNLIHKAYGIMQVRKPAMDDVNKAYGTDYTESDLMELNPQAIAEVGVGYLAAARDRYGAKSYLEIAAIYNGGPAGPNNRQARNYAIDVLKIMQEAS